ncbi:MAG: hypothetical protein LH481_07130, partial [Burkholderiales bacterium]|nr:hypothetical protein [Burkholderiales bacterium]
MSRFVGAFQRYPQSPEVVSAGQGQSGFVCFWMLAGVLALAMPVFSHADSRTGTNSTSASLDFRIVIPAIIRVSAVTQPDHIVIEHRHISQGYIDLDAGTMVKITHNTRNGYLLAARYDAQFLTKVEVQISGQNLTASSGAGSMRVRSGIAIDKLVAISYR